MATFQIHEDIENIGTKHTKKYFNDGDDTNISKKTFGEKKVVSVPFFNRNALKEHNGTKIPIKKCYAEKQHLNKSKVTLANVAEVESEVSGPFVSYHRIYIR